TGAASAKSNSVTPTGPVTTPGAPTGVSASAGDAQASVKWTAPSSNGGSTITSYTVTASPGGKTATSKTTSATVAGLSNGTAYTFTVTATNSAGTGAASAKSNSVTPSSGPPPVTSKPQTTNSHYIRNLTGKSSDEDTATAEGKYDAGKASPDPSLILLSYGDQTESPAGATETGGTGHAPTDDEVVAHAKAYIDGWRSADTSSQLTVVVSVNNDLGWIADDATAAGKDWADNVVDPVKTYAAKYSGVIVDGGMDIEGWGGDGTYDQTKAWIQSFLDNTSADFVNHGAASGCPETYTSGQSAGCNDGWTQGEYYQVSGGLSPSRISVLPQIYNNDMDDQWEAIDLVGITQGGQKLNVAGVLSENRANSEDNGSNSDLSPSEAWNHMWDQLQSSSQTKQSSLPYSTDLFDDNQTTTPPTV
ncbi:fibronectin type III domain-containing protein, partial [Nocardioides mangrovicus]|uniref:fibronectin type III domain-containing protein n=1 Tax=Nocardioides mangrovicus TaxID=2478913 RepID=UPI0018E0B620